MINFIYVSEYLAYKLTGDTTTKKKTNINKMNVLYCWQVPHPGSEGPMIKMKMKRTPGCCIYIVLNIYSLSIYNP